MSLSRSTALAIALWVSSCSPETGAETGEVTPWLDGSTPESVFPSDRWTRIDAHTSTGLRVDLRGMPEHHVALRALRIFDGEGLAQFRNSVESLDGFSGFAPIMVPFSGPLDPKSVRPEEFAIVDVTAEETVPLTVRWHADDSVFWVVVQPGEVLRATHRHVLLIRGGLRDLNGSKLARAAVATGQSLQRDALAVAGWSRDEILGAVTFTVQDTTGEMIAISERIAREPAPQLRAVTWTSARVIEGEFEAVNYRSADGVMAAGTTPLGKEALRFYLKLPTNHADLSKPMPLAIWAHGLTGDRTSIPEVKDTAIIAIDAVEHGTRATVENKDFIILRFNDFASVLRTRDNYRQSVADIITLARMLPGLSGALAAALGNTPAFRSDRFSFVGGSLGGILAGAALPLARELENGIVVVGGAGLAQAFQDGLFMAAAPNVAFAHTPVEREMFFAFVQMLFDRADGVNYLRHAIVEPLAGHAPRNLLFLNVIGDPLVPNRANETWVWAAGLEWLAPVHQNLFELPVVAAAPVSGNLESKGVRRTGIAYQFNPDKTEASGLGRHGYLADHAGARRQIEHFFKTALDTGVAEVIAPE